jgi:hypothetical protein
MNYEEQERIQYIKQCKLVEQNFKCASCGIDFKQSDVIELAHIVPKRLWLIKIYSKEIIHHPMNMKLTHSGYCNSDVQISPNKTKLLEEHVDAIRAQIAKDDSLIEKIHQRR